MLCIWFFSTYLSGNLCFSVIVGGSVMIDTVNGTNILKLAKVAKNGKSYHFFSSKLFVAISKKILCHNPSKNPQNLGFLAKNVKYSTCQSLHP